MHCRQTWDSHSEDPMLIASLDLAAIKAITELE